MKKTITKIAALIFLGSCFILTTNFCLACNCPTQKENQVLNKITKETHKNFQKLDKNLTVVAKKLGLLGISGPQVDAVLKDHFNANSELLTCSTLDNTGKISSVYSTQFKSSVGTDVSNQSQVKFLNEKHQASFGAIFKTVEGPLAVIASKPVFSPEQKFIGSVSDLMAPEYLVASASTKVKLKPTQEIWAIQTDGVFVYNSTNKNVVGLSIFDAPDYKNFPELITLAKKIIKNEKGSAKFTIQSKDNLPTTTKTANWNTIKLYNNEWRLIVIG